MSNDQLEYIVPASVTIILFIAFFGTLAWVRWLRYLEVVALADRGFAPREDLPGATSLRWGMVLMAIGVVVTAALYPVSIDAFRRAPFGLSPILLGGLLPLAIGLALIWHYRVFAGRPRRDAAAAPLPESDAE